MLLNFETTIQHQMPEKRNQVTWKKIAFKLFLLKDCHQSMCGTDKPIWLAKFIELFEQHEIKNSLYSFIKYKVDYNHGI